MKDLGFHPGSIQSEHVKVSTSNIFSRYLQNQPKGEKLTCSTKLLKLSSFSTMFIFKKNLRSKKHGNLPIPQMVFSLWDNFLSTIYKNEEIGLLPQHLPNHCTKDFTIDIILLISQTQEYMSYRIVLLAQLESRVNIPITSAHISSNLAARDRHSSIYMGFSKKKKKKEAMILNLTK